MKSYWNFLSRSIVLEANTPYNLKQRSKGICKTQARNLFRKCWSWCHLKELFTFIRDYVGNPLYLIWIACQSCFKYHKVSSLQEWNFYQRNILAIALTVWTVFHDPLMTLYRFCKYISYIQAVFKQEIISIHISIC